MTAEDPNAFYKESMMHSFENQFSGKLEEQILKQMREALETGDFSIVKESVSHLTHAIEGIEKGLSKE